MRYTFVCKEHGQMVLAVPMAERDEPRGCPECGALLSRAFDAPALITIPPHMRAGFEPAEIDGDAHDRAGARDEGFVPQSDYRGWA